MKLLKKGQFSDSLVRIKERSSRESWVFKKIVFRRGFGIERRRKRGEEGEEGEVEKEAEAVSEGGKQ